MELEFRDKPYVTELVSYDNDRNWVISRVNIEIEDYNTFCEVVEAVTTILKKECKKDISCLERFNRMMHYYEE